MSVNSSHLNVKRERPDWGDVYEETMRRCRWMYQEFETIVLSYSGGKDSHLVLECLLDAWDSEEREENYDRNIHLLHIDDEFVFPETEEHVIKYAKDPRITIWWVCLPVGYNNGCTQKSEKWMPWDPDAKDVWIRDKPDLSHIENAHLIEPGHPKIEDSYFEPGKTKHKHLPGVLFGEEFQPYNSATGVRADEAMYRFQSIMQQGAWSGTREDALECTKKYRPGSTISKPCMDWTDEDLWHAFWKFDHWEYNKAYDKLAQAGVAPADMRTAHPYTPEGVNNGAYKKLQFLWPELYDKARRRVEGGLMGLEHGEQLLDGKKKDGQSWADRTAELIANIEDEELKEKQRRRVEAVLNRHDEKATFPLPDESGCEFCGMSWRDMATALEHGDHSGRQF